MADFPIPSFLLNNSVDELHAKMKSVIPDDIDMSEGGHAWNHTRPTAYIGAYLAEFVIVEAIKLIWPKYAQDYANVMLDHAESRGIERKAATYATGEITITGSEGTEIPTGSEFSTASVNGEPAVEFETLETVVIDSTGTVTVKVQAIEAGKVGNVPAGTIILKANKITGITDVTNAKEITGGTDEESIEDLQQRIINYDMTQGASFVGSISDYERWALEVGGTGSATVIGAQDDSGLITIILTDANGDPANEVLREAVYNHIMRPDSPRERLAPVNGGNILVTAPDAVVLTISVTIETDGVATLNTIKENILSSLQLYMVEAKQEGKVRYTEIGSIISSTGGVEDYKDLLVNGGTANITINDQQLPTVKDDNLTISIGTV